MCTAITYNNGNHYFGRNLDLEYSYREEVTITPRNYVFSFKHMPCMPTHYAIIGIATVSEDYPLYYDATNEAGLSMAGLNFPENAVYHPYDKCKDNIAPYELIPWILGQCKTVNDARSKLEKLSITDIPFSKEYPLTPLHWMLSDRNASVTIEQTRHGLQVLENPIGVLTNNPTFAFHMHNLQNYLHLKNTEPICPLTSNPDIKLYSRGLGAFGLPGDISSASRFVRAAFVKFHSVSEKTGESGICQFFHILNTVQQPAGCVKAGDSYVKTVYSSCCNTDRGAYYYTTYENSQISCVDMHHTNLDANTLTRYPLIREERINMQN